MTVKILMKKSQQTLAVLLMISVLTCTIFTNAAYASIVSTGDAQAYYGIDVYEEEFVETINIEGINYTYYYSYNEDGKPTIVIKNDIDTSVDKLVFDKQSSNVYLNNEVFGSFESVTNTLNNEKSNFDSRSGYTFIGSDSMKITWGTAATVAVIAGIIAGGIAAISGLPGMTAASVIATIGSSIIGAWVGISVGGTLYTSLYQKIDLWEITHRSDWGLSINGEYYGDYSWYVTSSPMRNAV